MAEYSDPGTYTALDLKKAYHPLKKEADLDVLLDRISDSKYVLLGEASHGTHEFYTWRSAITKRLIKEKKFNFIAVEGDWPDCYRINRFIKGYNNAGSSATEVIRKFERWPTWMWANWEIISLTEWLKDFNTTVGKDQKVGFYGLDVYSLWESLENIIQYLEKEDPEAAKLARNAVKCFEPYGEEGQFYAQATRSAFASCEQEVIDLLREIRISTAQYEGDGEAVLNARQNAMVIANAEKYYRAMISFGPESWNIRDRHMAATLDDLMEFHGKQARTIVWEHNTHIGDARATSMRENGMINLGQLVREKHGNEGVVLVGFGTYKGEVIAGDSWGAPMKVIPVPEAKPGSIEDLLHGDSRENKLFFTDNKVVLDALNKPKGHRAIGVVYRPERESGNYVPTQITARYDVFIFIDETKALNPLYLKPSGDKIPDTYPFSF